MTNISDRNAAFRSQGSSKFKEEISNMEILVQRKPSTLNSTPETLSIDGVFECFTLEDVVREVPFRSVSTWKIPGRTAIRAGTYQVIIDFSNRFQRQMPQILNVDEFDGVRIHRGNASADTEGCTLFGQARHGLDDVIQSKAAFEVFFTKLQAALQRGERSNHPGGTGGSRRTDTIRLDEPCAG